MVIRPVSYRFEIAAEFRTYRLANISPKYNRWLSEDVSNMNRRMKPKMERHISYTFDRIKIHGILKNFI